MESQACLACVSWASSESAAARSAARTTAVSSALVAPTRINEVWALDFMHDALYGGRRFRILNVLDEANREGLAVEVGTSIPATRVIRVLTQLVALYGRPTALRLDNGPELTAQAFTDWCQQRGIGLLYIQPGKPVQKDYASHCTSFVRFDVIL
jgi:putative transposase